MAAQAIAEPAYGPRCLDAIAAGASAQAALARARAADEAALLRQVGVVAADGSVAAMTGEWCIDHAGHLLGDGFAVQANMMASPAVWPAMAEAGCGKHGEPVITAHRGSGNHRRRPIPVVPRAKTARLDGASTVGRAVSTAPDLAFLRGPVFLPGC